MIGLTKARAVSKVTHYILLEKSEKIGGRCECVWYWLRGDVRGLSAYESYLLGLLKLLLTFLELNNGRRVYGHGA